MTEAIILIAGLMVGFVVGILFIAVVIYHSTRGWVEAAVKAVNEGHDLLVDDEVIFKGRVKHYKPGELVEDDDEQ